MVRGTQVGLAASAPLCPQMWMSVNERIMQVACTTVSTSLAITDAPAMMDSTWHMMDTTVWVSKGQEMWVGGSFAGKKVLLAFPISWARRGK